MKHECKEAQRLRFLGQQLGHKPAQKQSLFGQIATGDVGTTWVSPTLRKGGVDGIQYRPEPAWKLFALRDAKRNSRLADLVLCSHQALTHGCRGHEERRGNHCRVQPEYNLQN